jgi:hypothetical protein
MPAPIVFISRWKLRGGNHEAVAAMFARGVDFIASTKPRTALFGAYLNEAGDELRFVHAVPDAAAMTDHFVGAEDRSGPAQELMDLLGFEVYGEAPDAALDLMKREAAAVGGEVRLLPVALGGYLRPPA